ncbi:hypothetical protein EGN72_05985 [Pseudorhodobacter sp. E13]|uniref:hypothetical protein n=1 Tax=Pseudorhodobacter sp. E13 TaxID=2487931 RepID=UPI000F9AFAE9|nr:hypothetical protein [Pseudorhodobacter sp. E13]RUS63209.1 hypothetical protein EGN72_05985 [Pseudorhodobacter sp. E13]
MPGVGRSKLPPRQLARAIRPGQKLPDFTLCQWHPPARPAQQRRFLRLEAPPFTDCYRRALRVAKA